MRSRLRSFERLTKDGKAGLYAKHGSAAYKPEVKRSLHGGNCEYFEPIYNAVSCELRGFKTTSDFVLAT